MYYIKQGKEVRMMFTINTIVNNNMIKIKLSGSASVIYIL